MPNAGADAASAAPETADDTLASPPTGDGTLPDHPTDALIALIVAFLAPMFLSASAGDVGRARLAALETLNAYGLRNQADLLAVAQIIALSLATLDSIGLSLRDETPPALALRLRSNANTLIRSQDRLYKARAAIAQDQARLDQARLAQEQRDQAAANRHPSTRRDHLAQKRHEAETQAAINATERMVDAARAAPPPDSPKGRSRLAWATAAAHLAREFMDELPSLSPSDRREASLRAGALSDSARYLLTGEDAILPGSAARPLPQRP